MEIEEPEGYLESEEKDSLHVRKRIACMLFLTWERERYMRPEHDGWWYDALKNRPEDLNSPVKHTVNVRK